MRGLDPRIHLKELAEQMVCRVKRGNDSSTSRRDQRAALRIPPPQAFVGQFGAALPAVDGVMPAEIVGLHEDCLAEVGKR